MSGPDIADWLGRTEACRELSREERLALAAAGSVQTGWEGADLMREGDPGDSMLLLLEGEVLVLKDDDAGHVRELARVGPGTLLGETALLERVPRTATVRAVGSVRYFEISRPAFDGLADTHAPVACGTLRGIARSLARRQRLTNERLVRALVEMSQRGIEAPQYDAFLHDLIIELE